MAPQHAAVTPPPTRISASMFYKYEACPHWLFFEYYGDPAKKAPVTHFAEMLLKGGMLHEERVIEEMDYYTVEGDSEDERVADTVAAMKRGERLIYHGVLRDDHYVGIPDLLERRDGEAGSVFGAYHYVPVEIKSAERVSDAHKYQLYCYGELLQSVQGHRPVEGYVLNGKGVRIGFLLGEFDEQFERAVLDIKQALAGSPPPAHVASSCKQSPWFKQCLAFAEQNDDIALLYNVKKKVVQALRALGVNTVHDAAAIQPNDLMKSARLAGDGSDKLLKPALIDRIILQARALLEKRHFVRRRIMLPEAPTEIFFDIEGDPLRQAEYLFGFLVRRGVGIGDPEAAEEYICQVAEKPEDESKMWAEFLSWVSTLEGDYVVYHYGTYELSRIISLEMKHGLPAAQAKALNTFRDRLVDLNEIVKDAVVLPLYFYSIKDIGKYVGFIREGEISGGGESVAFYEDWLNTGDRAKLDAIIQYNREDVVGTRYLKDWLARERDLEHDETLN